jgi:hypothetical protein
MACLKIFQGTKYVRPYGNFGFILLLRLQHGFPLARQS